VPVGPGEVRAAGLDQAFHDAWAKSDCKGAGDSPTTYAVDAPAATVNLFFHHNVMHDYFAGLGFDADAGAMQVTGGPAPDPIVGMAQAGAVTGDKPGYLGRDNAYMMPLPDGLPSYSGMYLFEPIGASFEAPCADGDFDASVIYHEYTHGVTNRWVGAEFGNLASYQGGAMGESWGDFYGVHYLTTQGLADNTGLTGYVTGNPAVGLRNFSLAGVPVGFDDLGYDPVGEEVHADGEIWSGVLWSIRSALASATPGGAELAAQLIADAMPISGPIPTMLDMRDAILAADKARDGGRFNALLWTVFAEHGMGASATTKDADDGDPHPGFDHPDPARNGTATLRVLDAKTRRAIANAPIFLGTSEARASAAAVTGPDGSATLRIIPGVHPFTVRARGFGAQLVFVDVRPGHTTSKTFRLPANVANPSTGAHVVTASSGNPANALDDTEATAWTATLDSTSDDARTQSFVVRLAGSEPVRVRTLQVSGFTTPSQSDFSGLRDFTVDWSADGRVWQQALRDEFVIAPPAPAVWQVGMRRYVLPQAARARYLRLSGRPLRTAAGIMQVAELQAFGDAPGPTDGPRPRFHDEGTILLTSYPVRATTALMSLVPGMCRQPPPTQGITAYVTTLPASLADGTHHIRVTAQANDTVSRVAAKPDVDLAFLGPACELLAESQGPGDETATVPGGARYVVTENSRDVGGPILVRVDAVD
jgi:hypothetical protein